MKRLISIPLFFAICFGTKTLGSEFTDIWNRAAHHLDIKMNNGKTVSFEDMRLIFHACNYGGIGKIRVMIKDGSSEGYEKVKQMMDEIQAKIIKVTPFPANNEFDKNGICCYSTKEGDGWNGYAGGLNFRLEDIRLIKFY